MRYLVDTDWAIEHMRRREPVVSRLAEFNSHGLGMSIVSVAELYEGVFRARDHLFEEHMLMNFLDVVDVIHLDYNICRIFAQQRGRLRAAGNLIGDMDILIGATALRHNLTLLSNNRRHFERLEGLNVISA